MDLNQYSSLSPTQKSAAFAGLDPATKSAIVNADLTTAGVMVPQVAKAFTVLMIKEQAILPDAMFVSMRANTARVPTAQMNTRVLQPGTVGTALAASLQAKPTFAGPELTSVECVGEIAIDDTALEDNIELEALKQTVLSMGATRMGFDVEDASLNGDTSSVTDALYAQQDGWRKLCSSHTGSAGSATLDKALTKAGWKSIPQQYRKGKSEFRFLTADDASIDFADSYTNRVGDQNDSALRKGETLTWNGIQLVGVPAYPNDISGDETELLCTRMKNLVYGVQRDIRMEQLRAPRERQTVFIFTIRRAAQVVNADEASKLTAVAISAT